MKFKASDKIDDEFEEKTRNGISSTLRGFHLCVDYHRRAFTLEFFGGFLVVTRSRIGLSSSSSSTTYAPVVPSENVTINPSSPSGSVVSIRINSTVIKGVYSGSASKSVSFCSSR